MKRTLLLAAVLTLTAVPLQAAPPPPHTEQWHLDLVNAREAWHTTIGTGARIAVVDSGVDTRHPDLVGNLVGGASFGDCPSAPDGCGTGDWRDPAPLKRSDEAALFAPAAEAIVGAHADLEETTGLDLGDMEAPPEEADYDEPHGTAVAGLAAATGEAGAKGVAPGAGLLSVNVHSATGLHMEAIANGVRWATRNGADVINLSLGTPMGELTEPLARQGVLADELRAAVDEAVAAGVVVVAAAGNYVSPLCGSPGSHPGVLCVVGADQEAMPTWFSNRAVKLGDTASLTVAAPIGGKVGSSCTADLLTTWPRDSWRLCEQQRTGYEHFGGTSGAAPQVAGLAALLAAQCRTADEIIEVITSTAANPLTGERGAWDPVFGYGLIDAAEAVAAPSTGRRTTTRSGHRC